MLSNPHKNITEKDLCPQGKVNVGRGRKEKKNNLRQPQAR